MLPKGMLAAAVLAALLFPAAGTARAARLRFHYAPADASGTMALQPMGPGNSPGERVTWLGLRRQPEAAAPRPTHWITFRHPATGRPVTVPVSLPLATTPRNEYAWNRVIYNYGSYAVEIHFLSDGSVDVVYDSGLLRAP